MSKSINFFDILKNMTLTNALFSICLHESLLTCLAAGLFIQIVLKTRESVKEDVLLDEKWSGADEEKCGQQADCCRGDRSLHYQAVGAARRISSNWSEERQDKGEQSRDPLFFITFPFQLPDLRQSQAETSQSDDGEDDDAVVAEEGEDKGEREQSEEDVRQEVEGRLQPLGQGRLFSSFACSDPVVTAALISRHNSPMDIFAIASFL